MYRYCMHLTIELPRFFARGHIILAIKKHLTGSETKSALQALCREISNCSYPSSSIQKVYSKHGTHKLIKSSSYITYICILLLCCQHLVEKKVGYDQGEGFQTLIGPYVQNIQCQKKLQVSDTILIVFKYIGVISKYFDLMDWTHLYIIFSQSC